MEYYVMFGIERSDVVYRYINFNLVDECNFNIDDLMCDKEVLIIFK